MRTNPHELAHGSGRHIPGSNTCLDMLANKLFSLVFAFAHDEFSAQAMPTYCKYETNASWDVFLALTVVDPKSKMHARVCFVLAASYVVQARDNAGRSSEVSVSATVRIWC